MDDQIKDSTSSSKRLDLGKTAVLLGLSRRQFGVQSGFRV